MARKRLGEILLESGLIDEATLRAALTEQRRFGGHLGRVLVDMKKVLEEDLVAALSRQLAVPVIDLDHLEIPQAVIELVPGEVAESYSLIPFAQPMKFLDVAMGDPTNQTAIDELRVRTQLNIRTYLAGPKAMERALFRYYGRGMPQTIGGRRVRSNVDLDAVPDIDGDMELVGGYELDVPSQSGVTRVAPTAARAAGSSPMVARVTPASVVGGTPPAARVEASPSVSRVEITPPRAETATPPPQVSRTSTATTPPQVSRTSTATTPPATSRTETTPLAPRTETLPQVSRTETQPLTSRTDTGQSSAGRAASLAEVAALQERIANLEALVRRDEDVLKKLMALLIEKGVATRDEIIAKLK